MWPLKRISKASDSAPAHKAREAQAWCPHLNPLDYSIWGFLEAKVNDRRHRGIAQLKTALQEAWREIDEEVLASVVDNWRRRLNACLQAKGGYIEYPQEFARAAVLMLTDWKTRFVNEPATLSFVEYFEKTWLHSPLSGWYEGFSAYTLLLTMG
uniref:Uncharacterized protein n=1 Tax=Ditylenchus dipsaci TaxID=166011 RepID=A0A915E2E9_9BILA